MLLRRSFTRYAWTILAGIALAVGGGLYVRPALTPSIIALPAKDIDQMVFSTTNPADGWMIATSRTTPMLYESTNGGSDWHRVPQRIPRLYQILEAGTKTWVLVRTARHDPKLASFPNEWATVYFPTMQSTGMMERIRATTRSTLPWSSFEGFLMSQQPSNANWLLAESIWNPGTVMVTLFHWNSTRKRWTAVTPTPLGVRGDVFGPEGITVTGSDTLWWSSGGSGSMGQLDRITMVHYRANIQAITLPGLPMHSACRSGGSVLTGRTFGVPAFSGPRGHVTVSWVGCSNRVHFGTWATTDGGRHWHRTGILLPGAAGDQWVKWASFSVGYAWSIPQGPEENGYTNPQWWTTTDGGKHWVPTIRLPMQDSNALEVVTPQDLWVLAENRVLHSTDAGIHWTSVRTVDVLP